MLDPYCPYELSEFESDDIPRTKEPVWILGKSYNYKERDVIKGDILSRLWFSYRKGFQPIGDSGLTSDKGWGCMLRCGQMLIAQALLFLHLGREWRWNLSCQDIEYLKILRMFEDRVTSEYSIHKIALEGANEGKEVGSWFGPNTVVQVLKKLSAADEWSKLAVHVAMDNTLIVNDVKRLCKFEQVTETRTILKWKPLLLVIPLRLGIQEINPVYISALKVCFTFPQSLGVIGGKPNHALYFIGCVGNSVIYLDPHTTQPIGLVDCKIQESEKKIDSSYHYNQILRISITQMDPSVAIGFLCKSEKEFDKLIFLMKQKLMCEKQRLFELREEAQVDWSPEMLGACSAYYADQNYCGDSDKEEYEFI